MRKINRAYGILKSRPTHEKRPGRTTGLGKLKLWKNIIPLDVRQVRIFWNSPFEGGAGGAGGKWWKLHFYAFIYVYTSMRCFFFLMSEKTWRKNYRQRPFFVCLFYKQLWLLFFYLFNFFFVSSLKKSYATVRNRHYININLPNLSIMICASYTVNYLHYQIIIIFFGLVLLLIGLLAEK